MVISKKISKASEIFFLAAVLALVALDQLTKAAIRHFLPASASIPIVGFVHITNWVNTGSVFGLFPGTSGYIALLSLVVVPAVIAVYLLGFLKQRLAVTLLVAGLVGNTIDRLSQGFVTDFIYLRPWPAFNIADACLTIGIMLFAASFILPSFLRRQKEQ